MRCTLCTRPKNMLHKEKKLVVKKQKIRSCYRQISLYPLHQLYFNQIFFVSKAMIQNPNFGDMQKHLEFWVLIDFIGQNFEVETNMNPVGPSFALLSEKGKLTTHRNIILTLRSWKFNIIKTCLIWLKKVFYKVLVHVTSFLLIFFSNSNK